MVSLVFEQICYSIERNRKTMCITDEFYAQKIPNFTVFVLLQLLLVKSLFTCIFSFGCKSYIFAQEQSVLSTSAVKEDYYDRS